MTPETLRLTNLPPAPRYWPYANLVSSFPLEIRRQSRPRFSFWHDWKKKYYARRTERFRCWEGSVALPCVRESS